MLTFVSKQSKSAQFRPMMVAIALPQFPLPTMHTLSVVAGGAESVRITIVPKSSFQNNAILLPESTKPLNQLDNPCCECAVVVVGSIVLCHLSWMVDDLLRNHPMDEPSAELRCRRSLGFKRKRQLTSHVRYGTTNMSPTVYQIQLVSDPMSYC